MGAIPPTRDHKTHPDFIRLGGLLHGLTHNYFCPGPFGPGFCLRTRRPASRSNLAIKRSSPSGRPVRSCSRRLSDVVSSSSRRRNSFQSSTRSSKRLDLHQRVIVPFNMRSTAVIHAASLHGLAQGRAMWTSKDVRLEAARNPHAFVEALQRLASDGAPEVAQEAAAALLKRGVSPAKADGSAGETMPQSPGRVERVSTRIRQRGISL